MRDFDKPIGKVWRRLRLQRFLTSLTWCLGAALLILAGAIAAERLTTLALPGPSWAPFAVAGGAAVLVAGLIALLGGASRLDAARAIDRAFHLNERLATAMTLPEFLRETPAGRAQLEDTKRKLADLDIASRFGPRLPKRAWVPAVPALLAVGLLFVPERALNRAAAGEVLTDADMEQVSEQAEALKKRVSEARKKIDKSEYAESDKLLVQIENAAEELSKAPPDEKEKALVKMNQLTNQLRERQEQIGDSEAVNRKLQQLKRMSSDGPADEFARELAKGDFKEAAEKVKELRDKLLSGEMTEREKEQLKEQLDEMRQQLQEMANLDERKKQLEEAREKGQISQEQFDRQMAKLNDQAEDLKKMQQLAQQMAQAQQAMEQGQMQQAAEALGMSQQQLEQMASELAELEMLDAAMADLQMAKEGMAGGEGLNQIGDRLDGLNAFGQNMGNGDGNGNGLGRGRGRGERPIAADDTSEYATRVRQQLGKGKAIQDGFGRRSTQTIGESVIEATEAIQSSGGVAAEALSNQKVPKHVKEHVQGYLDTFRDDD